MKKVWIGAGITVLLIIIANITAQKLIPDRAVPIRVFATCLCILIPSVIVLILLGMATFENVKEKDSKGKRDIKGTLFLAFITLLFLASMVFFGIRGTKAMKDMINGPIEQPIHKTQLKKRKSTGYRVRTTNYYLNCYTYDEKNEPLKVQVNKVNLDDVKAARVDSFYMYGLDDKYMLRYFENLKILVDLQVLEQEPEESLR